MAKQYIYVVYEQLPAYPREYIVRRRCERFGKVVEEEDIFLRNEDYANIKLALTALDLVKIDRSMGDHPNIKETWI